MVNSFLFALIVYEVIQEQKGIFLTGIVQRFLHHLVDGAELVFVQFLKELIGKLLCPPDIRSPVHVSIVRRHDDHLLEVPLKDITQKVNKRGVSLLEIAPERVGLTVILFVSQFSGYILDCLFYCAPIIR